MPTNSEQDLGINPDLLNKVDRELVNRLRQILTKINVKEVRNNTTIGLLLWGNIQEARYNSTAEPIIEVRVVITSKNSIVTLTLYPSDYSRNELTPYTAMSQEQKLHLAFVAAEFSSKLQFAFGTAVSLNDLLNSGKPFSFVFDPNEFDREQGGIEDLSRSDGSNSTMVRDL